MTWLTPVLAGVAAAIAVPSLLILYFLKLRRRDVEISSTLLWKKAIRDLQANAPFQRLRRNILLIVQMLALVAALAALGQPLWSAQTRPPARSVILIDRSASMSAMDARNGSARASSRLERAKADAKAYVDSMSDGGFFGASPADEAMVIAFDASAQVVQPYTTSKTRLREAIEAIAPTDASTTLDEAMKLAGAYTRRFEENRGLIGGAGPPIILWSDGVFSDISRVNIPPETSVEYRSVGAEESGNVGITAIRAQRAYDKPGEASIFVALQSVGSTARNVDVQLAVDGVVAAVRSVAMPAPPSPATPSTAGVVFRLDRAEGAIVSATLLAEDALAADNQARVVLTPARRLAVGVVTQGNLFLKAALEGLPLSRLDALTPAQFEKLASGSGLEDYDAFVLDHWVPSGPLPPAGCLIFGAAPEIRGVKIRAGVETPQTSVVMDWDRAHPALQHVTLENLVIANPMMFEDTEDAAVIARGPHGPVIVEAAEAATHAIVVGFDVTQSNWPFDVGFVVFMASAVRYLGDDPAAIAADTTPPGGAITTRLPAGVGEATVTMPDGSTATAVVAPDGRVSFGPVLRAGIYTFSWNGPPGPRDPIINGRPRRAIPVNLLDPTESRIGARPTLELPAASIAAIPAGVGAQKLELWPWLLLGVFVILLLEWWIYHRRVRL